LRLSAGRRQVLLVAGATDIDCAIGRA